MDKTNKEKHSKVSSIIINTILTVIFVLILIIFINVVLSIGKGYTSFFGKSALNVVSNSMNGVYDEQADLDDDSTQNGSAKGTNNYSEYFEAIKTNALSSGKNITEDKISSDMTKGFKKGDLIFINILSENQKQNLKVGDIITFYYNINGNSVLNSHRIIELNFDNDKIISVITKGDNNSDNITELKSLSDVVGVYEGNKINGIGTIVSFFNSSTGFLICVVIPSFLIVLYCLYMLIKTLKEKNKEARIIAEAEIRSKILKEQQEREIENQKALEEEKSKLREEILKEIQEKQKNN